MPTKKKRSERGLEVIKWLVVTVLMIVTIVGNYFYRDYNLLLRAIVVIVIAIVGRMAMMTAKGKSVIQFALEVRNEVRKVIWPTYPETFHATLIIIVVTTVISLIMWGLDSMLVRVISFIHGLRFSDV